MASGNLGGRSVFGFETGTQLGKGEKKRAPPCLLSALALNLKRIVKVMNKPKSEPVSNVITLFFQNIIQNWGLRLSNV